MMTFLKVKLHYILVGSLVGFSLGVFWNTAVCMLVIPWDMLMNRKQKNNVCK